MKKQAFIFDIDGTLALKRAGDPNSRHMYDWKRVGEDVGFKAVIKIYTCINNVYRCLVVSGRNEVCRKETLEWLGKQDINTNEEYGFKLFMRKEKDYRADWIIKEEIYHEHIEPEYDIVAVFDDRNSLVHMWRQVLGIPCMQAQYGRF